MKIILAACILLVSFFFDNPLIGRWESKPSAKGNITGVVFRNDSTFEGYVNRKSFASGTYQYNTKDSVFSFTDNVCNGVKGVYKIVFFNQADSLRFQFISDSCTERRKGMEQLVMGRFKIR